ncbi:MAG TPA: hypothetical protein VJG49_01080 [Candidatus Nanoarchaeia archaeon]|nr:hypothetical protein [Candidatus Nanoarchaeia archaeon]
MEIKDIQPKSGNIDVVLTIVSKDQPRAFEKFGKSGRVCNAKAKDNSGEITLTLWNEQIDQIEIGDKVHISNGWCSEYKEEKQLSTGKFGKLEVVQKSLDTVLTNDPGMLTGAMDALSEGSEDGEDDDSESFDEEESIEE